MEYRQLEWTPELVARFWNWLSRYPEQYFTYQFGRPIVSHLRPFLAGRKRVLDYGCGTGFLIPHLTAVAQEVVAADHSPDSVAETNRVHGALPRFAGAYLIETLLEQDRSFDATVCIEVIEHLYDSELDALLDNIRRLSAPGACNIFTTPNDEALEKNFVYCPVSDVVFHRYQHVRNWNAETLPAYLEARGFEIERVFATNLAEGVVSGPKRMVRAMRRRLCGGGGGETPHLVCIARARPA